MSLKYEAVLFDLGNVLLRISFKNVFKSWAESGKTSLEEVSLRYKFDEAYAAHEVGAIDAHKYHSHICSLLGLELSYEEFLQGWNSIFGDVIEETSSLITELKTKKYQLFVLSNSNVTHRNVWSERYKEILSLFDRVFCSSQIGFRKPHPEAFEKVCQETGLAKEKFLFIDDLSVNVDGAKAFGIKSILFEDPIESVQKIRSELQI